MTRIGLSEEDLSDIDIVGDDEFKDEVFESFTEIEHILENSTEVDKTDFDPTLDFDEDDIPLAQSLPVKGTTKKRKIVQKNLKWFKKNSFKWMPVVV